MQFGERARAAGTVGLILVAVLLVAVLGLRPNAAEKSTGPPSTLEDLVAGRLKIIDLTHTLNEKNPHWPGDNYSPSG